MSHGDRTIFSIITIHSIDSGWSIWKKIIHSISGASFLLVKRGCLLSSTMLRVLVRAPLPNFEIGQEICTLRTKTLLFINVNSSILTFVYHHCPCLGNCNGSRQDLIDILDLHSFDRPFRCCLITFINFIILNIYTNLYGT